MATDDQQDTEYRSKRRPMDALINTLPSEILASIMWIVVSNASQDKDAQIRHTKATVIRYPEVLSHVSSHWRQVAIDSHNLWSHIHISLKRPPGSRVTTFLDRAGQVPLHLCLSEKYEVISLDLIPFLAPIPPRLKSLELIARSGTWQNSHTSVLSTCLAGCTAGKLTELEIRAGGWNRPFFKAHDQQIEIIVPSRLTWVNLDLPGAYLEDVLRGVTSLRLFKIHPQWTSNAYVGLVELRIVNRAQTTPNIAEYQLVGIMKSSPRLRILHFDLPIVDILPLSGAIGEPIVLHELEVLNLGWSQKDGTEILFRWLAPSPKLRQFSFSSLRHFKDNTQFGHPATIAFLAGSGITMIHVHSLPPKEIIALVTPCSHVRDLACRGMLEYTDEIMPFQFNTLYLIECAIEVDSLRRLIQTSSIQSLVIYHSKISRNRSWLLPHQIPAALSDVCSDVLVLLDSDPSPIAEWEVFWMGYRAS